MVESLHLGFILSECPLWVNILEAAIMFKHYQKLKHQGMFPLMYTKEGSASSNVLINPLAL